MNNTQLFARVTIKRLLVWFTVVAAVLMVPLVAMQFTAEVNWDVADFAIMGGLLIGVALAYELIAQRGRTNAYRAAMGVGLATAFLLIWVNGAVGIIGSANHPANWLYLAVLTAGAVSAGLRRFEPTGMKWIAATVSLLILLIPVVVLAIWPPVKHSWGAAGVGGVVALNTGFSALFALSAWMFWQCRRS